MNKLLDFAIGEIKRKKYDGYFISISNENLYEFTRPIDNYVLDLTGFTGDTGSLLITRDKSYLYVDGRFTIQAKKEVNDKRIKIIEVNRNNKRLESIVNIIGKNAKVGLNPKTISCSSVLATIDAFKENNIKIVFDDKFMLKEFKSVKKEYFNLTSAPLFLLDRKYVSKDTKTKIKECIGTLMNDNYISGNVSYVTSSLEEIAYITNLRYKFCDIDNHGILFDAFLILNKNKSALYIKDYLDDESLSYITKSNIVVKNIKDFYSDLKRIKNKDRYYFDKSLNNYCVYKCLATKNKYNIIESPLTISMSIRGKKEIEGLRKANTIDGLAMTKVIYQIKKGAYKKLNSEYKIKKLVDDMRVKVGNKHFLCSSFDTIVAYKENSAICHYIPMKDNSKKVSGNGLLLIDSGGNYNFGTTDMTRTISLYKGKIPKTIKRHYSLVLESMLKLSMAKFPSGITGFELDILARSNLYNEYLDFNHGTGHGIGYISNVHEGPNRIGPGINNNYKKNTLMAYQVTSNEPGLYFENKYGIRIENDMIIIEKAQNEFGDFLGFETLTLCPYDIDLIDKKYLSKESIMFLNKYNKLVYKKLSKYLTIGEQNWLKKMTREV